jgi:hypothetical protein
VALVVALPLGIGALFLFTQEDSERGNVRGAPVAGAEAPASGEAVAVELLPLPEVRQATTSATTTVLWPLKVELELLEARYLPKEEGVPPIGSGAGARITGQIADVNDGAARVDVAFVAGANAGRVLHSDASGRIGANDLYPGLSVVEVRGPGILGSRRELRFRRGQETPLNIGYGRPGSVAGKVQDAQAKPIEGASVVIDGTRATTDAEGGFFLPAVAAGQVLCEVEKEGFAFYQELVWVQGGVLAPKDRMTFTLKPAAELRVALGGTAGGPGPAQIYVLSDRAEFNANTAFRNESFPWHKVNPIEAWPGRPVTIGNLRPEVVKVHVFRPGAKAASKAVNLATNARDVLIDLEPAPVLSGIVTQDGTPVLGASVRLEAPDRVRAMLGYFSEPSYFLETAVLPNLPPALQETKTDKQGRFVLSAWSDVTPVRYLEARAPGGGAWASRLVRAKDENVALELGPLPAGDGTLLVEFPGRHQGLPIELWIGGAPVSEQILGSEDDLEIGNLLAGRWKVTITWHAQPVKAEDVTLEDTKRLEVPLPVECIEGQNEEQWKRAGREFPQGS